MVCVLSNEIDFGPYLLPNTLGMRHCTSTTSRNSSCRLWKKGVLGASYFNQLVPLPLPFHTAVQTGILGSKAS